MAVVEKEMLDRILSNPFARELFMCDDDQLSISVDLNKRTPIPFGEHPGAFGAKRRHDVHTGVDLYAEDKQAVFSIEAGVVVGIFPFTGALANCPWWLDTDAIAIEDDAGVWLYGEVRALDYLCVGKQVFPGQQIAHVERVLRNYKGRPTSMLHLERYQVGTRSFAPIWELGSIQPDNLIDPTATLREIVELNSRRRRPTT